MCDFRALLDFNDFIILSLSNSLALMITKPEKHACFQKLCILFFGVFKNKSPTTSSHSALFGFIRTFEFDESKKTGAYVNFKSRALGNQRDSCQYLKTRLLVEYY